MGQAAPHSPDGASGLPADCPDGDTRLGCPCGVEFYNILHNPDIFCFLGRENRWGWSPSIHFIEAFGRDSCVSFSDLARQVDIAIQARPTRRHGLPMDGWVRDTVTDKRVRENVCRGHHARHPMATPVLTSLSVDLLCRYPPGSRTHLPRARLASQLAYWGACLCAAPLR